ncbi:TetR/AcrR family transcriptional regulator [Aquimarina sp. U1-2]|uniref:TetR/AcrR family transcriptional regulator n=1 Tax=Aquimarina sp. U1-2 TaxID=2823141 RepID=UPI001AECD9EE|nr:TetR/AcrR family transcriptional regulator [Aquimarina sp. U1-2]MBP2831021.1 TetR/AcrR family transcriptional regulator [Aquimarina sp. U1-2]
MPKEISTEATILQAAREEFVQHGYAGARMQAIADRANINKAMLHYYFRSKELLFQKILSQTLDAVATIFLSALGSSETVKERLHNLIDNLIDHILHSPETPIFILNEIARNSQKYQSQISNKMKDAGVIQNFFSQIKLEQDQGIMISTPAPHIFVTLMSLIVFPFLAKPVIISSFELSDNDFEVFIEQRKILIKNHLEVFFIN